MWQLQALTVRKMWDNTIIVFLGDNGAPNNNAGANTMFKGEPTPARPVWSF